MKRRTLLAGAGSALSLSVAGCIDDIRSGDDGSGDPGSPSDGTPRERGDHCGPASQSLSELLAEEAGDASICPADAAPSFALENERETEVTVSVNVGDGDGLAETYTLPPGERVVEPAAFETHPDLAGTITVGTAETEVAWPDRSCYRYGVSLTPDGVENGWVEPLRGPGDTQHDCYAGDDAVVYVRSEGENRTVEVTVTDRCDGGETTETFELDAGETEQTRELLTNGGVYDIDVDVEDGGSESYEFREECWGLDVTVAADGEVSMQRLAID